ncbi:MAG: HAD hydrolase-like protein [Dakarella massiliensis]
MKPAAALFDFDGTLVDTEGPDCALISRMLLEVGIRKTPNEVMKDFIGLPRTEIEGAILARYGVQVPPDWIPAMSRKDQSLRTARSSRREYKKRCGVFRIRA